MRYVTENRKVLRTGTFDLDMPPVIGAERFTPEVIAWIGEYRPYERITDSFEFPVIVSTSSGEVYCLKNTPFLGGLHYRVLRKWAASIIGFQPHLGPAS